MRMVIESARRHINDYVLEHLVGRMDQNLVHPCIEYCKHAVRVSHSFREISASIFARINSMNLSKKWHVIAFSLEGGESCVAGINYFKIRFEHLVIEIFST